MHVRLLVLTGFVDALSLWYCTVVLSGVFTTECRFWANTKSEKFDSFRLIALTSSVIKVFEKILKHNLLSLINCKLEPLQFAYQAGKGVDDAKILVLDITV